MGVFARAVLRFKVNYSTDGVSYASLPDSFWVGGPGNDWGANTSHVGGALVQYSIGDPHSPTGMQACQGRCYNDDHCAPGLKCFQCSLGMEVPGCFGETPRGDWNYCYDPTGWEFAGQGESLFPQFPEVGDREVHSAGAAGVVQ